VPRKKKANVRSYYSEKELRDIAGDLTSAVTVPVNVEIKAEHRVLDLREVEKVLRDSENIFLQECGCRKLHHNCNSPLDTCLAVNVGIDYAKKWPDNHSLRVNVEEALDALRRSHKAGLVHMAYVFKGEEKPQLICSCCTCCCHTLGGIVGHGITTQVLTSKLIAVDDESKCRDCGKCAERCAFGARTMVEGKKKYDKIRCFGCGLCVSTCPERAIKLVERKKLD
jgi:Pyruvate/2-oxoacid:ferredoxin oxidoreductase delta subunit